MPPRAVFEDGGLHTAVQQHGSGALGAAAIVRLGASAVEIQAVGTGHADIASRGPEQVGQHARRGRLAVDAGNGDEGNAARDAGRKEGVDDCGADGTRRTGGWLQMHTEARPGIDLDDRAALVAERAADVFGDDIDSRHVEADGPRGIDGVGGDGRMDTVGHVGGGAASAQVRVAADENARAGGRDGIGVVALLGEDGEADRVELDPAQGGSHGRRCGAGRG